MSSQLLEAQVDPGNSHLSSSKSVASTKDTHKPILQHKLRPGSDKIHFYNKIIQFRYLTSLPPRSLTLLLLPFCNISNNVKTSQ